MVTPGASDFPPATPCSRYGCPGTMCGTATPDTPLTRNVVTDWAGTVSTARVPLTRTGEPCTSLPSALVTTGVTVAVRRIVPNFDRSRVTDSLSEAGFTCTTVAPVRFTAARLRVSETFTTWSPGRT